VVVTTGCTQGRDARNPTSVRPEVGFSICVRLQPVQTDTRSARKVVHHHQLVACASGARDSVIRCMVITDTGLSHGRQALPMAQVVGSTASCAVVRRVIASGGSVPACQRDTGVSTHRKRLMNEQTEYDVVHEPDESRFAVHVGDLTAVLDYQRVGSRLVLPHTGVPRELEGHGIGNLLAREGLEWARSENLRVVPLCPFVRAYLHRHPEYASLTNRPEE
jgi:predicted GNAT family acetyltransferase